MFWLDVDGRPGVRAVWPRLGRSPGCRRATPAIYFAYGINLVYQFFVHTGTIGKLPGPVEFTFNTASHHRVHHGSDAIYLDRNYGGILIVWDRMFGTFQPELFRPKYGLTHPVGTYNLIKLQYGDYTELWRDVRHASSWRARLGYLFMPPNWQPGQAHTPDPESAPA